MAGRCVRVTADQRTTAAPNSFTASEARMKHWTRFSSFAAALLAFVPVVTLAQPATQPAAGRLDLIQPSEDKTHFVLRSTGQKIVMWGFNYDRDDAGRLLEDYWADEWDTV